MAIEIPAFVKEHKYGIGITVIVGGVVVLYLLASGSSGGGKSSSSSPSDFSTEVAAEGQLAQVQAGEAVQTTATQAQTAQSQLAAQVADYQTSANLTANQTSAAASLAAALAGINAGVTTNEYDTAAQTAQLANQIVGTENTTEMQDQVLESQINSGVIENANNNATALAGTQIQAQVANAQIGATQTVALAGINDNYDLESANDAAYNSQISYIAQNAGDQKNSALDANDQTALFQSILAKGNPSVAISGNNSTSSAVSAGDSAGTALTSGLLSTGSSLLTGLFG